MKKISLKSILPAFILILVIGAFAGCSSQNTNKNVGGNRPSYNSNETIGSSQSTDGENNNISATELIVRFGDDGEPFVMHLYDNDTARAIARHVGTADWRTVTEEAAGTVYYSEPNRIVLFYGDAEVTGEYTPVGYFDNTEEFHGAVENNPVLEGWGNKIVHISDNFSDN